MIATLTCTIEKEKIKLQQPQNLINLWP